jgi:glycosyltransferase involved in cell wall biosynthesis
MFISVVIPTRNRTELLKRAVASALAQTYERFEVIVVVDGPDDSTVGALSPMGDSRLRWTELPESRGGNHARNIGCRMAKGEWIAFLDDDDEWFPEKLSRQAALVAECKNQESLVVSCRFLVGGRAGQSTRPRRLIEEGESVGDYLYDRRSLFDGETSLNTSTLLVPKKIVEEVQFSPTVRKHQETDFLLRASDHYKIRVLFAKDPLAIWHWDGNRPAITNRGDWARSLEWIRSHRARLSRRAYSGFVLISLTSEAASQGAWSAFFPIVREAFVFGSPTLVQIFRFCCMWLMPKGLRQRIRLAVYERSPRKLEVQDVPG